MILIYSAGSALGTSTQAWLGLVVSLLLVGVGIGALFDDQLTEDRWIRIIAALFIMVGSAAFIGTISASDNLSRFATIVLSLFVR